MNQGDVVTEKIPEIDLQPCFKCSDTVNIYRVTNKAGLLYSTIDCHNCGELTNIERTDEQEMIDLWNGGEGNSKNTIQNEETTESDT